MISVDAIQNKTHLDHLPLEWVGMGAITSTVRLQEEGRSEFLLPVKVQAFVNLVSDSRGIHMSRIYNELQEFSQKEIFSFKSLQCLGEKILKSQGAISDAVKLEMEMQLPLKQMTLKSQLEYQKEYPLKVSFLKNKNHEELSLFFKIDYSSTCPQSAALSHEVIMKKMKETSWASIEEVIQYLQQQGLMATPHAQRSTLDLQVTWPLERFSLEVSFMDFVADYIAQLEMVLGTPTQGVVKRADEQEFAILNAKNLMFCEDAARKVKAFLKSQSQLKSYQGKVTHIESLHSHDAVAEFRS